MRSYLTARDGQQRLAEFSAVAAGQTSAERPGLASVHINPEIRFQTIEGFGGAFTEAAAVNWQGLPAEKSEQLLRDYFDPLHGHGYGLCRVHINSCDFALGNYAHAEVAGDLALRHFSIARDRRSLLPMIKAAQRIAPAPLKLLASPWSPPPWMKSNGAMNGGGRLLPEFAATWAQCYVRFIRAYEQEGVPIWALTVQNEPLAVQRWDSCIYSAEEERDFVRDHLGPALAQAGLGHVKLLIWDHNRDLMVERASTVYSDPEAAKYVWGCGFHWYGEDHFDHVRLVHDAWPDKALLFTEGCQEGGPHLGSWAVAERYARSLINDLNGWAVGWIDWNLLLDERGGPNHVGNLCSAPIMLEREHRELLHQSAYYVLGHFSRFVKPGARRVLCAATRQDLEVVAFRNPDQSLVLVVCNRSDDAIPFTLRLGGATRVLEMPAHAIATHLLA